VREIRTLRLTWRGLETEPRDGLRHRHRAKAAGKQRLPIPNVTAPVFDPTLGGCALQAHTVQPSAMAALTKHSEQSGTESCVVYGNVPDEA
jgi:hypothetical protein